MSKFSELFQAAIPEFDEEDKVVALAISEYVDVLKDDLADMQKLFPDLPAEAVTREGKEIGAMLKIVFEREKAADARGADNIKAFFSFVTDVLEETIEQAAADQDSLNMPPIDQAIH